MYACELEVPPEAEAAAEETVPLRDPIAEYPLTQTFHLHSLPGSKRVIYLNFRGAVVSGTVWNTVYNHNQDIVAAPFDMDFNPGSFSNTELQRIQNIWRRVAEDYVPFDVDVTTEEPDPSDLTRSRTNDEYYGNTVIITPTTYFYPGAGGVSYIGTFNDMGDYYKPSWVFSSSLSNREIYIAEACAHENGHAVGLHHQGITGGTAYYQGQGDWAPIMGTSYYKDVTQWAKGEYAGANNTEDALRIIQNYGLAYYPDDHGDTEESASPLDGVTSLSGYGFIEQNTDVDVFQFVTGAGTITLDVTPVPLGPDLKILAELRDKDWNLIASSSLEDLGASISRTVSTGIYYLAISGTGSGDPLTNGYSDYASLGQYAISGSVVDPGDLAPPAAAISASPVSGEVPLEVSFSGLDSTDDGVIDAYLWDFGDGSPLSGDPAPIHTYNSAGSYEATLKVTDNLGLKGTASVTITVTRTIHVESIVLSPQSTSTSVSANALVTIVDSGGNPVNGASVFGTWSGIVQGTFNGSTGSSGTVEFSSPQSSVSGPITFRVTGVLASGCDYDAQLNEKTEASIEANLVDPPVVEITSPSAGDTVLSIVSINVSAASSLGISFVDLNVDGAFLGRDQTYPYSFLWDTEPLAEGTHTLTATAQDVSGVTSSTSIDVIVTGDIADIIPPGIRITSPKAGAVVSGTVSVSVSASDNVGITRVELYVNGNLTAESTSTPFTMLWNTDETPGGRLVVQAIAYDEAGNSTVSPSVSVAKQAFLQRPRTRRRR